MVLRDPARRASLQWPDLLLRHMQQELSAYRRPAQAGKTSETRLEPSGTIGEGSVLSIDHTGIPTDGRPEWLGEAADLMLAEM